MIESEINNIAQSNTNTIQILQSSLSNSFIESSTGETSSQGTSPEPEVIYDNYIYQDNLQILKSESGTINFNSIYEARHYLDLYIRDRYKTTATIPSINGIDYIINIKNILAYSLNSDRILIEFTDTSILEIICINTTHATKHYEYLNKLYTGYGIYESFSGTRIEVNPGESIQQAVQGAISGDMIIVNSGDYAGAISLKNGVDIYFKDGCTLTATAGYGLFNDYLGTAICNIYGFPDITVTDCLMIGLYKNNSDIYLEVNEARQTAYGVGCFYQYCDTAYKSTIRVKGYSLNKYTGVALGISDFDGYGNIFGDYDFIKIISPYTNLIYGFTHNTGNIFIVRNMYSAMGAFITIESSNYYDSSLVTFIFTNCRFKNTYNSAGTIFIQFDPTADFWQGQHKTYLHNCYMSQSGNCIDASYAITAYLYGVNISKTDKDVQVTLAGTGTLTVDTNLTISEV